MVDVIDSVPFGTEYVSASPVPLMVSNTMTWHVAPFADGAVFTATFSVRVLPGFQGVIPNVAIASIGDVDWTSNEVLNVTIPTAIQLVSFNATRDSQNVAVHWQVASEQNTLGYRIYRSLTGTRASATLVSGGVIAATGSGGNYAWVDEEAPTGASYYWLEEVENSGAVTEYGPAVVGPMLPSGPYLPLSLTRTLTGAVQIELTPPLTYMLDMTGTAPWPGSLIQVNRYQVPSYIFVDVSGLLPITSTTWTEVSAPRAETQYWVLVRFVEPGGANYTERWFTGIAPAWDPAAGLPIKTFIPMVRR